MTRRFRRRPSATVFALLALAVVMVARYTYDRIVERPGLEAPGILQEGGCQVVRVLDGDSIVVRQTVTQQADVKRTTSEATIRLLGIACPEYDEPWGLEATEMTRRLLDKGPVTIRLDRRRIDRNERVLAYVFVDDRMVNAELVRAGLARVDLYPGDSQSFGRIFSKAQAEAKADQRGIWDPPTRSPDSESSRGR
jgi:micrococcal nuclease